MLQGHGAIGSKAAEDPRPETGAGTTEYAMESGVMEVSGPGARNGCGGSDDRRAERMDRGQSLTPPRDPRPSGTSELGPGRVVLVEADVDEPFVVYSSR